MSLKIKDTVCFIRKLGRYRDGELRLGTVVDIEQTNSKSIITIEYIPNPDNGRISKIRRYVDEVFGIEDFQKYKKEKS